MPLHTYTLPPSSDFLRECNILIGSDDALLLMGDGVYNAVRGSRNVTKINNLSCDVFALIEDCQLAGIQNKITPEVKIVDYAYFVLLSEKHEKHIPWD